MNEVSKVARRIRPQEALEALQLAFTGLVHAIAEHGYTNGELNVSISLHTRVDNVNAMTSKLHMDHYHYGKYESRTEARGFEWDEVFAELLRQLSRDASLKRLTHQPEV